MKKRPKNTTLKQLKTRIKKSLKEPSPKRQKKLLELVWEKLEWTEDHGTLFMLDSPAPISKQK